MTVGAYVRISSTKGQSVDSQVAEIQRWLDGHGHTDVKWFIDEGVSGSTMERDAMNELKQSVFRGETKVLVCYRLDRLSRSMLGGLTLISQILDQGCRVVSVTQALDLDSVVGKTLAAVILGMAEAERESILIRQAAGIELAKQKGKYKGRQKGTTKANPSRAKELAAKGNSPKEVAAALNVSLRTAKRYLSPAPA